MYKILKVFLCMFFLGFCFQSYGSFQIVEIFPNTTDDKNLEYIVVQNISEEALSLSGYTLSDISKEYVIITDDILEVGKQQKFLRPETKLILNNSNEKVFLRDIDGEIIDSVVYETSQKGEAIIFEKKEIILEIPEILISDEAFISGEVLISDEVVINPPSSDHNSVPLIKGEDETQGSREIIAPEIIIGLQRPSYISQSGSTNIYFCDNSKEECKVNFDLRDSFRDIYPEKDYICEIGFGVDSFVFGEEQKCNPNTVIFPQGEYELTFRIIHENDSSIFSEKKIFIKNILEEELISNPSNSDNNSVPLVKGEDETQGSSEIISPEIIIGLQRPSYITQSGSTNTYLCDSNQEECKVNFDLHDSFRDIYPEKDYICEIDFGGGEITGEENKCNPNTIVFPEGVFEVIFYVKHKDNNLVFSKKIISVVNTGFKSKTPAQVSGSSSAGGDIAPRINVGSSNFIIQSGLSGEGFEYECLKEPCKINLKYTPKYKAEKCFWNFAGGEYSHPLTQHKCNPSYVELPEGIQELSLKVYDTNYEENFIIFPFTVYPKSKNISVETLGLLPEENINPEEKNNGEIALKINLQGKLSKEKSLSGSILTCSGVGKCYVNLEGIIEGDNSDLEFSWKLNDEMFSEKLNPGGIWVEGVGIHEIVFQVGNIIQKFNIIITNAALLSSKGQVKEGTEGLSGSGSEAEEIQRGGQIEGREKKLKFTQNFLALKYDGLRISGKAPIGSKLEIYIKGEKILSGETDEKGKYRIVSKAFKAGEYSFDTKVILETGEEIFLETSGEFILKPEKRASWFIVKKVKTKKSSSKRSSTKVPPKLVVKDNIVGATEVNISLSFREKIVFIAALLFLGIFMLLHMILKTNKVIPGEILSIYLQQFSVKHKVTLILP